MKIQMQAPIFNEYLKVENDDWSISLEKSFAVLRKSWEGEWVGLPYLLSRCVDFLHLSKPSLSSDATQMLLAAIAIAESIEFQFSKISAETEPKYHNRLHIADVLTAISVLIYIQSKIQGDLDKEWIACALLSAIAHDFDHPGKVNQFESEIESKTVQQLQPLLLNHQVPSHWCKTLESVILRSDFSLVKKNHQLVKGKNFQCNQDWLIVFLNEADVMASASDKFGLQLGNSLAQEWRLIDFPAYQSVATETGRKAFLRQLEFSSAASRLLKINVNIAEQLDMTAQ
jgi:hypothetical protein